MARYTGTVEAPHGAEEVWHYLADLRSAEEWDPSVDEVELIGGEPRTEGARYQVEVRFRGRSITLPYRIVEVDPPHRVVFAAETDSVVVRDEARIDPRRAVRQQRDVGRGPPAPRDPEAARPSPARDLQPRRRGRGKGAG